MKPRLVFRAPLLTRSGYGSHAREILQALIKSEKFDLSVIPINWGGTPFLYNEEGIFAKIKELSLKHEQEKSQNITYDISVQVTIPNEFEKLARYNIGITAGIETDRVSPIWIEKANTMVDLLIVPSKHAADVFVGSRYQNQTTGKNYVLQKPVHVCPEAIDSEIFNPQAAAATKFEFSTKFNFLSVGLGLNNQFGEDRKNVSGLIKWFCERFKDDREVGLVLKTAILNGSVLDQRLCVQRIKEIKRIAGVGEFPKIHLIHGNLSDEEMAALYTSPSIKAYVACPAGEGFCRPALEAAACNLPVIITNWSGHLDFLSIGDKRRFIPLDFDLIDVPRSQLWEGVIDSGARWARVKEESFKTQIKKFVLSPDTPRKWAVELGEHIRKNYNTNLIERELANLIEQAYRSSLNPQNTPVTDLGQQIASVREQLKVPVGTKTLLFTMPESAGDVLISTATVSSLKKKFPEHLIYFATNPKYLDILKENADIYRVIGWENWMVDVNLCEKIFDEVYTPNLAIQLTTANWVHGGKGRQLADEIAAQCRVELGDYFLKLEEVSGLPEKFIAFNPGSGKGQWEARNYLHWQDVIDNVKNILNLPVLQVGLIEDPLFKNVLDFRSKTNYNQLAYLLSKSELVLGIDSVTSHMAAVVNVPQVSIYGSSYPGSTGPIYKQTDNKVKWISLEPNKRYTCEKACYKYTCSVDKNNPCVNEITSKEIFAAVLRLLTPETLEESLLRFKETQLTLGGYVTVLNAVEQDFPFIESIKSVLGCCDEVVVVDGNSTDGTWEKLQALATTEPKLQIYQRAWDWEEPGMDGMQKAYARSLLNTDFLIQLDADESLHEKDYPKYRQLIKKFPQDVDVMHLPVVELWDGENVRTDRHSWKWRLSRNNWRVTHGIVKHARVLDEKSGKTFAKKGMSDGCEYIDLITGEYLPHQGFYNNELEMLRKLDPLTYGDKMNDIFGEFPSTYHFSWYSLKRKIKNFVDFWDRCWGNLYQDAQPQPRFLNVNTHLDYDREVEILRQRGGEHDRSATFKLKHNLPLVMQDWAKNHS